MKLHEVFSQIQNGDCFLFEGVSCYAKLIRWWTSSKITHVGMALRIRVDSVEQIAVIEALEGYGVRLHPIDIYLADCEKRGIHVHWWSIRPDASVDRDKMVGYALKQWGKRYASWWQFLVSWGNLTRWFRKHILGRDVENINPERHFCSEFVSAALQAGGYQPNPTEGEAIRPEATEPGAIALYRCLERQGILTL